MTASSFQFTMTPSDVTDSGTGESGPSGYSSQSIKAELGGGRNIAPDGISSPTQSFPASMTIAFATNPSENVKEFFDIEKQYTVTIEEVTE
jgi:hypothetical protein